MGATLRIVAEFLVWALFLAVYAGFCMWLTMAWPFLVWAGAFTGGTSEAVLIAVFSGGIIGLILLGFLWRWCDWQSAKRLDQIPRR